MDKIGVGMAERKISSAEEIAETMKSISVAEFFEKNRHLLGYENSTKALITITKEAVDNSLDACDEAGILPDIQVTTKQLSVDRFKLSFEDNGPGIVESKISMAFGKMLFGSKFHRLQQSRGTQGIGISGAILYAQLTTGKPVKITSSTGDSKIHEIEMMIDTVKNEPSIVNHMTSKNENKWRGIKLELEVEGTYIERFQSIPEYLKQTAIANPYAHIVYKGPNGVVKFERTTNLMPKRPKEIKPHPYGIELGILRRMLLTTNTRSLKSFLTTDFSRVGSTSADQILKLSKLSEKRKPDDIDAMETERLHKSMQMVKLISPPTDCLSPLTEKLIENGLRKEIKADYYVAVTRPPEVYRGNPFQVEVGLAYGGELQPNSSAILYRFANKVPLLYNRSGCAIAKSIEQVDWKRYGLQQSSGSIPVGPLAILVHFASVWVPYTSEGKEAIASYSIIEKEIKLALQDAGRQLAGFIRNQRKAKQKQMRRNMFKRYIPEVAESLANLTDKNKENIEKKLESYIIENAAQDAEPAEEMTVEEKKDE